MTVASVSFIFSRSTIMAGRLYLFLVLSRPSPSACARYCRSPKPDVGIVRLQPFCFKLVSTSRRCFCAYMFLVVACHEGASFDDTE